MTANIGSISQSSQFQASRRGPFQRTTVWLLLLICGLSVSCGKTQTMDHPAYAKMDPGVAKAIKAALTEKDPDFAVPNGSVKEILDFAERISKSKTKSQQQEEMIRTGIKSQRALIAAGDAVLQKANKDDAESLAKGASWKITGLMSLAINRIPGAVETGIKEVEKLKKDPREPVAAVAKDNWIPIRMTSFHEMSSENREAFLTEVLQAVEDSKFEKPEMMNAAQLGELMEHDDPATAAAYYTRLGELIETAGPPNLQKSGTAMKAVARRLTLVGNPIEISGKRLDGEPFDWESYRGKVVLIDFWATWCGPCLQEMPNVKKNYDKYHDKGFDVVGISLDRSRQELDAFLEQKKYPWVQLYDAELQKGVGWNHPVVQKYGINSIPTVILVDKEGKVVSLNARGPELGRLLEELLGGSN